MLSENIPKVNSLNLLNNICVQEDSEMSKVWSYQPLLNLIETRQLDADTLAKSCGMSKDTMAKIMAGEDVKLSTLAKLCLILKCSLDDIVEVHFTEEWEAPKSPNRMSHERWTSIQDEQLIRAIKDGLSLSQIADDLGRSESAVRNRIVRLLFNNAFDL